MTALAPDTDRLVDRATVAHAPAPAEGGTAQRLVRFAVANVRRRPERSLLATAGIGLAIAAVVLVRIVAASYQATGGGAVTTAIGDAAWWAVPEGGVHLDVARGVVMADEAPPAIDAPAGWTVTPVLTGALPHHDDVALVGRPGPATGEVLATSAALDRLGLGEGDALTVGGHDLVVHRDTGDARGASVTVTHDVAVDAGLAHGWTTLAPPDGVRVSADDVAAITGLDVVTDPARSPKAGSGGLVYATEAGGGGRSGLISFDQKMAALLGGKVTSSALGLVAQVGLALGFVIAVSTFVAAVQERRREFGIMASVGLTDEVLYFFLVESLLLFVAAYLAGVLLGGGLVFLALPHFFSLGSWLAAAGMVAMYLPALAVVAALVPVHRLLQQRPVALLAEEA
jgi:hypothetical protein